MGYKLNAFTGQMDLVDEENFSYKTVLASTTVTIPEHQQMIVVGALDVSGTLIVDGELTLLI